MDFSQDSLLSLPEKHDFPTNQPTCWILEGLIMYLQQTDVESLLDILTDLSAKDSLLLLNFTIPSPRVPPPKPGGCPPIDDIEERLFRSSPPSWSRVGDRRLMFGDEGFNFGRYPEDRPSNPYCGFGIYRKI